MWNPSLEHGINQKNNEKRMRCGWGYSYLSSSRLNIFVISFHKDKFAVFRIALHYLQQCEDAFTLSPKLLTMTIITASMDKWFLLQVYISRFIRIDITCIVAGDMRHNHCEILHKWNDFNSIQKQNTYEVLSENSSTIHCYSYDFSV